MAAGRKPFLLSAPWLYQPVVRYDCTVGSCYRVIINEGIVTGLADLGLSGRQR